MSLTDKIKKQRKEKDSFFKSHPRSPLPPHERDDFTGLNYYPVNSELRFTLKLHEHSDKEKIEVADNQENKQEYIRWGEFRFTINSDEHTLQAYKSKPHEERLWVPFKDETNGEETYGAGRYIDLVASHDKKGEKWVLDFNQAYNPFCAYNESYVCPFVPAENWLKIKIKAGEKQYQ